jgi:ribokinase
VQTDTVVVVIGSIHEDRFSYVDRLPGPGETVIAHSHGQGVGGKGANQAVAAARLGADVALVGMVGADAAGDAALTALSARSVAIDYVGRLVTGTTGYAAITVDAGGENEIVVCAGANGALTPEAVEAAVPAIARGRSVLVVAQGEAPLDTIAAASRVATGRGRFLLNLAPSVPVAPEILARADPLVVNLVEARQLADRLGICAPDDDPRTVADTLRRFASSVVITLGGDGAVVATAAGTEWAPPEVPDAVVDTTGAGDAFVGALAASLASGAALSEAVRVGCRAGAIAVSRRGTTEAYAIAEDLVLVDDVRHG